jgi:hypothetical protein
VETELEIFLVSTGQKIGLGLVVAAFIGAKIFVLFSGKTGMSVAALGAVLMVFSESAEAN